MSALQTTQRRHSGRRLCLATTPAKRRIETPQLGITAAVRPRQRSRRERPTERGSDRNLDNRSAPRARRYEARSLTSSRLEQATEQVRAYILQRDPPNSAASPIDH